MHVFIIVFLAVLVMGILLNCAFDYAEKRKFGNPVDPAFANTPRINKPNIKNISLGELQTNIMALQEELQALQAEYKQRLKELKSTPK